MGYAWVEECVVCVCVCERVVMCVCVAAGRRGQVPLRNPPDPCVALRTSKLQRRQCSVVCQTLRQLIDSLIADVVSCKPHARARSCVGEFIYELNIHASVSSCVARVCVCGETGG